MNDDQPKPQLGRLIARFAPRLMPWYRRVATRISRPSGGIERRAPAAGAADRFEAGVLIDHLAAIGVVPGDTIMLHSSWDAIARHLDETTVGLVKALRSYLGSDGTLAAPAYADWNYLQRKNGVFDVRRAPSGAGVLSEVVRRQRDAVRSLQRRSVAAVGASAELLVKDHHRSPYCSGKDSPYARLSELGGKVVCLGIGATANTMFHCGEDIMGDRFPVQVYPNQPDKHTVLDTEGATREILYFNREPKWNWCCDSSRLLCYFNESVLRSAACHGLAVHVWRAAPFLDRVVALARQGIHIYGFRFPALSRVQ